MLTVMVDIDGTISAAPQQFRDILGSLQNAGYHIVIVSGTNPNSPSGPTWDTKVAYLKDIGFTTNWDELVVVSGDLPQAKALWCQQNNCTVAIDNDKQNAQALVNAGVALVLVPWATRE